MGDVAAMLKSTNAQGDIKSAREIAGQLRKNSNHKILEAANKIESGIEETLTFNAFPRERWILSGQTMELNGSCDKCVEGPE